MFLLWHRTDHSDFRMAIGFIVLSVLLLPTALLGFEVDRGTTLNHQEITKRAFLNVIVQVCRDIAEAKGKTFTAPVTPYTIENVLEACGAQHATKSFYQNLKFIQRYNIKVDKSVQYTSPSHHFHNEAFTDGRDIIAVGLGAVKASNKKGNYKAANKLLGKISHSLQDFYSHSNWIEIGQGAPNGNLLIGDGNLGNIAASTTATCRSCNGNNCDNNILNSIISNKELTSGYFALKPATSKPAGKCSHGGPLDASKTVDPTGGINKNTPDSSHGSLHETAANMAITATSELLQDIREAAGDNELLQMMGASSSKALCFVIDTTGSMTNEIVAIRDLTSAILTQTAQQRPSLYILVTFRDPGFGPLIRTTDPEEFKRAIDSLSATDGGDSAEMSLSGLRMALSGAPSGSDIYLFTDAPAKDADLKNSLMALIGEKKSVVNVMLTGPLNSLSDSQVYEDLALASGGQLIRVPKSQLALVKDIVLDSASFSLVTILEEVRKPGKSEDFTFFVDSAINNVLVYITGGTSKVSFVNPSGVSQAKATQASAVPVGNFQRINLIKEVGLWTMKVESQNPYKVKIVGESQLTFIYDILGPAQGPLGGLIAHDSRPKGGDGSLELTLIGSKTATVTEVYLLESAGARQVKGTVTNLNENEYLVEFDNMPSYECSVLVKGPNNGHTKATSPTFQRLASGKIKTSSLLVTADELNGIMAPGSSVSVPFSVLSDNAGNYTIEATNDQGFTLAYPSTLTLTGGKVDGTVTMTAPSSAESGTDVTLIIQAQAPGGTDMNYAVMSFTVLKTMTDFRSPVCAVLSQTKCSQTCSSSNWQIRLEVRDDTGVDAIRIRKGNGKMISQVALGKHQTVTYEASCCSNKLEMSVVDTVGNVGSCTFSTEIATDTTATTANPSNSGNNEELTTSMSPRLVQSSLLCFILSLLVVHYTS